MNSVEITVLVLAVAFVMALLIWQMIRRHKGKPSLWSDCNCGGKGKDLVKAYHASKKKAENSCCPHCHNSHE